MLANANNEDARKRITDDQIAALLVLLIALGRTILPKAVEIAIGDSGVSPELADKLAKALRKNEDYLTTSLAPAIATKLQRVYFDPDIQLAISTGDGKDVLSAVLYTIEARVESYATEFWNLYNWGVGLSSDGPIKAYLDPLAQHCTDCPQYHMESGKEYKSFADYLGTTGQRVPGDFECKSGCRCWLE